MKAQQWHADWWVTCAMELVATWPCEGQRWVDGSTHEKRYAILRADGWKYLRGLGWVCPPCAAAKSIAKVAG